MSGKPWSKGELDLLNSLKNNSNLTRVEIANHFPNRTKDAVFGTLKKLRLVNLTNKWSQAEVELLKKMVKENLTKKQIKTKFPSRTLDSIKAKLKDLKLTNENYKWTKWETHNLSKLWNEKKNFDELVTVFPHRTPKAILKKLTEEKGVPNSLSSLLGKDYFWTESELGILEEMVRKGFGPVEISPLIGSRSIKSIEHKFYDIVTIENWHWTEDEINILKDYKKGGFTYPQIIELLPWRTLYSLEAKAREMGISKEKGQYWNEEDDTLIIDLYSSGFEYKEMIKYLSIKRTVGAITNRVSHLGIRKKRQAYQTWSKDDDKNLRSLYKRNNSYVIINSFMPDRTIASIANRCKKLKLRRFKEVLEEGLKRCKKCYKIKELSDFGLQKSNSDARRGACLICTYETNRAKKDELRREATIKINAFFKENEINEKQSIQKEFSNEEDLQMAISHVLTRKYDLEVNLWADLEEFGYPDIYLPNLNLILEIKLRKKMWTKRKIIEQVRKYENIERTWLICLDESPSWATINGITWYTPQKLFSLLDDGALDLTDRIRRE